MKASVIVFPGSNCDRDIQVALEQFQITTTMVWHQETSLPKCDLVVLPGGFSYGDYLRSGAIAQFSPIMKEVIEFAKNGGYVFGVCNGFQILCEAGLLPGTLQHNNNRQFICKNVYLKTESSNSLITRSITEGSVLKIPIAHGEGNYFDKPEAIQKLEDNDQVLFRYSTQDGEVNDAANPNGAVNNIAGICNEQRNVFGMMPHPERASDADLGNEDGRAIFESILSEVLA